MGPHAFWIAVDAVTSLWVYGLRDRGFSFLATAMFFPGVAAVLAEAGSGGSDGVRAFLTRSVIGGATAGQQATALLLAVVVPCITVAMCAALSLAMGWATVRQTSFLGA